MIDTAGTGYDPVALIQFCYAQPPIWLAGRAGPVSRPVDDPIAAAIADDLIDGLRGKRARTGVFQRLLKTAAEATVDAGLAEGIDAVESASDDGLELIQDIEFTDDASVDGWDGQHEIGTLRFCKRPRSCHSFAIEEWAELGAVAVVEIGDPGWGAVDAHFGSIVIDAGQTEKLVVRSFGVELDL